MFIKDADTYCPAHGCKLHDGLVLINYGYQTYNDAYLNAKANLFPKSNFTVNGGCMPAEQIVHEIRYCPLCRQAHREWCTANSTNKGLTTSDKNLKSILEYRFGKQDCVKFVPDQVKEQLFNNQKVAAVKILQSANPGATMAELRTHLRYLMRQPELEKILHLMTRPEQNQT